MWLLPTSYLFYIWYYIYVHATLSLRLSLSFPPPCPQVHSLCLRLYSCPAPRFFITIFFYIPYTCVSIQYLFFSFSLTSLCMTDSRSIHLNTNNSISFLFMTNIPLYICATSSLSIHLSMDTQVPSMSWLL